MEDEIKAAEITETKQVDGLTDAEKLTIREAQLEMTKIEIEFSNLKNRAIEAQKKIEGYVQSAAQRLGKNISEWVLDIEDLSFKLRATLMADAHRALDTAQKQIKQF